MVVFGWFMRNFYCLQSPPSDAILPGLWKNWHTLPWLSAFPCTFLRLAEKCANCTHPLLKETLPQNINCMGAYCMLGRWMQGLPLTSFKLLCWKFRPPASRCKVIDISCQVMINGSSFRLCPFVHFLQCTPSLALYCSTRLNSHKVTI